MNCRIAAVVTTYNRLQLLKENINALLAQTYSDLDILVIDNNSNDGTETYMKTVTDTRVRYYNTGANLGGAGGFAYGIEKALQLGYDFAWVMDDDSIPDPDALAELVKANELLKSKFSFLASTVYWTDRTIFPMNLPQQEKNFRLYVDDIRKNHIIKIVTCSFVGCFINLAYAEKVGLPYKEYFIYGDDIEYTTRLTKEENAYWILDSVIVHKAPSKVGSDIVNVSFDRIDRFYMQTRNGIHISKVHGGRKEYLRTLAHRIKQIIRKSPDHKIKRVCVLLKGVMAGVTFNPSIKYASKASISGGDIDE